MPCMQSIKHKVLLPSALLLASVFALPDTASAQSGGGPAAYYSPSYSNASWAQIFERHRSWGNVVPGGVPSPNGLWCVHPDYRPGQVLLVTANGRTISCTVGDTVQAHHVGQWRSRWVIELSWSAFVALNLDSRNFVDSVTLAGVGGPLQATSQPGEPSTRYFEKTGFTVGHGFLNFWRANGGLAVFGYPLSGEIDEDGRTIQYFERAVFEFHGDKKSGNRILLRRVGAHASADLRSTEPFQPVDEPSDRSDHYFHQTGHQIADRFADYWGSRGGLAIFGYPISREFEQDGMRVQYFERAVFEWHPDKPAEHRILLRRLGAEALRATKH